MTREQEINAQFPDATKKPMKEEKTLQELIEDDIDFTIRWWRRLGLGLLAALVIAIFLIWLFYAVVYGETIDNALTPIK